MKTFFWIAAMAVAVTACASLTPEQQANAIASLDQALQQGTITKSQYDAAVEAIRQGGTSELSQIGSELLRTGIDVGLALLGVRVWRGSTIARKGAAPKEAA